MDMSARPACLLGISIIDAPASLSPKTHIKKGVSGSPYWLSLCETLMCTPSSTDNKPEVLKQTRSWEAEPFGRPLRIQRQKRCAYFDSFPAFWSLEVSAMSLPDSLNREERRERFNWRVRRTEWALWALRRNSIHNAGDDSTATVPQQALVLSLYLWCLRAASLH